jgi:uncharacterized protein (TIGR03435 family)
MRAVLNFVTTLSMFASSLMGEAPRLARQRPLDVQAQSSQVEKPAFEVSTVRRNVSGDTAGSLRMDPSGIFRAVNVDLRTLIANAYRDATRRLLPFQIMNAPDWLRERFDITAKVAVSQESTPATFAQLPLLVQSLLEERFSLKVHRETRQLPIYRLITSRPDRQLGPNMRVSSVDCAKDAAQCALESAAGHLASRALDLDTLVQLLAIPAQRMIIDRTGLTGRFDVQLNWRPLNATAGNSDNVADLFSALQEQLGLKLESDTDAVEVLVIDRIEHPNEN